MSVKIWYEASDGTKFDSLEAACEHEYKKKTETYVHFKPPVFMDGNGKRSTEYNGDTLICIFYSIQDTMQWLTNAHAEGNDFDGDFPHDNEIEDWINEDGYFAVYWNEWLEQWMWYCWDEVSGNYRKAMQVHEILKSEGLEK